MQRFVSFQTPAFLQIEITPKSGKEIRGIFFDRLILLNSSLAKTAPHSSMDKHLPGRIRSSTGEKSIHHPFCTPLPPPLNDRTCLPGIKECPQMERGWGWGVQQTKTARDKNTVFRICIKVTKPSPNPRHHFRTFLFPFFPWVLYHLSRPFSGCLERWRDSNRSRFISTFC
ncbi:hypothetical protein CDAR_541431 [Caerostris darwini]|uniref:Uncharacterized protein n=1 Tax=Caerostris darwini TaxID=1538125 RepID=A0AAV4VV22_9ARAC|nr:hypothetical protein CDAR_541431 [Caerostris darwini]